MSLEGGRNQSTSRESIQTHAEQGLGSALRTTQQQDRCTVALKGQMNCILRKHWENGGEKHTKHNWSWKKQNRTKRDAARDAAEIMRRFHECFEADNDAG